MDLDNLPALNRPACMTCGAELNSKITIDTRMCQNCLIKANAEVERSKAIGKRLSAFSQTVKKIKAPHISELCEEMVEQFGSLRDLAKAWKQQIDAACMQRPGGKVALDSFSAMMHLIRESTVLRQSAPDIENLSEEDIEREMAELLGKVMRGDDRNFIENVKHDADVFDVMASAPEKPAVRVEAEDVF